MTTSDNRPIYLYCFLKQKNKKFPLKNVMECIAEQCPHYKGMKFPYIICKKDLS